jgi:outer membrane protein assembly factor BamB
LEGIVFIALSLGEPFIVENEADFHQDLSREITDAPFVAWQRQLPLTRLGARSQSQLSAPTLHDGLIYVGSAFSDSLHVLESSNGSEVRAFAAHSAVQSEPILTGDHVIFCDEGGYTFNYSLESGQELWEHFGGAPITSQPTLIGDDVIVSSVDDSVYSLDLESGEISWRYNHPPSLTRETELTLYGAPSAVLWQDSIIVGFSDGSITSISRATGEVEWQNVVGQGVYPDIIATPIVSENNIYVGGFEGPFVSLNPQTNTIRWSLDIGTASQPTYEDNVIFHGGSDGVLRKIDTITGQVIWEWDADIEGSLTTPRITPAGIITTSTEETIYLIDDSTGDELWQYRADVMLSGMSSAISVGGSGFYAVTNKGQLIGFSTLQTAAATDAHLY